MSHATTFADLARPVARSVTRACDLGLPWLAQFTGWTQVRAPGFWPFVPGDLLKQVLAALLLPGAWRLVRLD